MKKINIFSKVGRNVHLTRVTKAKMIGIVIGIAIALTFITIHAICCIKWCKASKHELRYTMYCTGFTEDTLPENCLIDRFYMNK